VNVLLLALIGVTPLLGLVALVVKSERARPWLLPVGGVAHLALTAMAVSQPELSALGGYLGLDALGKLVLGVSSLLFGLSSFYAPGYLAQRPERPNRLFVFCLLAFSGTTSLIILSHHLGLMWVGLETATLTTAPLLYFNHNPRSLEAVWKYLLVGSVGIALALLGSLFLAYSALAAKLAPSLMLQELIHDGPMLSKPWLHAAFVLLFVGYGTKMGLAPMHTWKPDAYGEAPGLVGALLAGVMTNCAFLGMLRFFRIVSAAGDSAFARELMVGAGLFSMFVAGVFMARQKDYKRLLAYSSVEHMGILVLGVGLGGNAVFGSLLHLINNGITKGALFLSVANIHRAFGTKTLEGTTGALRMVPVSGALFLLGFFAVTGSPPFGPFVSEFTILDAAVGMGRYGVVAAFLALLVIIFMGFGATVMAVVLGTPGAEAPKKPETPLTVVPPALFLALSLVLGLYVPPQLEAVLREAVAQGVTP
jgi:hydrogenase-4 component F